MRKRSPQKTSDLADPDLTKAEGPLLKTIEDALDRIAGEGKQDVFCVAVGQDIFFFRRPKNAGELKVFQRDATAFVVRLRDKEKRESLVLELREAIEKVPHAEDQDLINAFTISFWSADEAKITPVQALKLTKNPTVLDRMVERIDEEHAGGLMVLNLGGVEFEKKG